MSYSYGMPGVGGRGQEITGKIASLVPAINVIMRRLVTVLKLSGKIVHTDFSLGKV
jgi:hypothetical protein